MKAGQNYFLEAMYHYCIFNTSAVQFSNSNVFVIMIID